MKIKVQDFWEHIGTVFTNKDDIYSSVSEKGKERGEEPFLILPKGTFIIVNQDSHGYDLYDIKKGKLTFFETGWVDDQKEFDVFYTPPIETLDLLIEALNKKIIILSAEGWSPNSENHFDLTPYLTFMESIVQAKNILQMDDSLDNSN